MVEINNKLIKEIDHYDRICMETDFDNFHAHKKPRGINEARKTVLDKDIEGHIIVCGIVKGIKNLILPLRSKF